VLLTLALLTVACGKGPDGENSSGPSASALNLEPRAGIAVRTASRTCLAIRNANLPAKTPIALIVPTLPQSTTAAEISGPSSSNCPVTEDVQPGVTSYDLHITGKEPIALIPLIGVLSDGTAFTMNNIQVQADLNRDRTMQTFRACRTDVGVHLTIWKGIPTTGTRLWHGFYYEPSHAVAAPICSNAEQQ
jgi:hypothetical protein